MTTPPLIDQHGNHRQQHGEPIRHVTRFTARGPERHTHAYLLCMTVRDCRKGELPVVELKHANHPAYFFTDLTPDDADQLPGQRNRRRVDERLETGEFELCQAHEIERSRVGCAGCW